MKSDFYAIEKVLAKAGYRRAVGESWESWLQRLRQDNIEGHEGLEACVDKHQIERFHPVGLHEEERRLFAGQVRVWIQNWKKRGG